MGSFSIGTCCAVVMLIIATTCITAKEVEINQQITKPPRFVRQPQAEKAYKPQDELSIELQCEADADPPAQYAWQKDGEPLDMLSGNYQRDPVTGTLTIQSPGDVHQGIYQCYASNEFGTAVSTTAKLKPAVLNPFGSSGLIPEHRPLVGASLKLNCDPPFSYPTGRIYWGDSENFNRIEEDDRIMTDFDGNLYFADVQESDTFGGRKISCLVFNPVMNNLAIKLGTSVVPQMVAGTIPQRGPELMWYSEPNTVAIVGTNKTMKCIFGGFPTPRVRWERVHRTNRNRKIPLPATVQTREGPALTISRITFDDEGIYVCKTLEVTAGSTIGRMEFDLRVESQPEWTDRPMSVNSAVDEDAQFVCRARGNPKPTITWSINGEPYTNSDNRQLSSDGSTISYTMLEKSDIQVLQCNASNEHGYIFDNAFLNVAADPPLFLEVPDPTTIVAEGQNINISCRVYGAPTPVITWSLLERRDDGSEEDIPLSGQRFTKDETGYLHIENVAKGDDGVYKCLAVNKFGTEYATGSLIVRSPTVITTAPESARVRAGSTVEFRCAADTDPEEMSKLTIEWRRNGFPIDYERELHIDKNLQDNTLQIVVAKVSDTADYTCVASNGLDTATAEANLVVEDRPSPPINVEYFSCNQRYVELQWEAGADNNSPITRYIPYYQTDFEKGVWHAQDPVSPGPVLMANIGLSPWTNFTFHVKAENAIGLSDPSSNTVMCPTDSDLPYNNPEGVCTDLDNINQLIITWQHMARIDHNGENFRYNVYYRPEAGGVQRKEVVRDWRAERLVVDVDTSEPFQPYIIAVEAENDEGAAPPARLAYIRGHTGEDTPLDFPENFAVDESTINATSAMFMWDRVDESPERIRGHFKGYKIVFWRESNPEDRREHDVTLGDAYSCPEVRVRRRRRSAVLLRESVGRQRRAAGDEMSAHIGNLWPYSDIQAAIMAVNNGQTGAVSPAISFSTPEGPPGIAAGFTVTETGSHHLIVSWNPPVEPNGIITGYTIGYHAENTSPQDMVEITNIPLTKLSQKIRGLEEQTRYRVTLWAHTAAGQGKPTLVEETTLAAGPPDKPGFHHIVRGDNYVNVSIEATAEGPAVNPGSHFIVEYRPRGSDEPFLEAVPEGDNNWVNISGLEPGAQYEIRIVALNDAGQRTNGDTQVVEFGPKREARVQTVAQAGWFIGMMCAIIFLLLILLIVCLIKRNRGGKYPVHEKEKLRGKPDNDDDAGFGEYNKTPYTPLTSDDPYYPNKSKPPGGSLDSANKPLGGPDDGSESDSMGEYADLEPNKFNEDGSFIGQYGGKKGEKEGNALQTFV